MAENNANNGNGGPNLATPSKRAEKKQDTRPTPERMKQKETEEGRFLMIHSVYRVEDASSYTDK